MANEKVISSSALIAKFQQALDEKWGYIWGTAGKEWTAADQKSLEKTTDSDRANSRKYGSKWIGHRVADCSGLFAWAFRQLGGAIVHGSNSIWDRYCSAKGELKDGRKENGQELLPGTAVFTYNKTKKNRGHIGLYIGNGWVIEARGAYYGVVMTKLTSRPWVEWGELKGVDYANTDPVKVPAAEPETKTPPTIRKGNRNTYVKQCQEMLDRLGYNLGICGVDGDFGTATEKAVKEFQRDHGLAQDGVCGPKTWTALEKAVGQLAQKPADPLYTVTVTGLSKAAAEEIVKKYGGKMTAE